MKNGCKDFVSPTLDRLGIEKYFDNRLNDIIFAQVALEMRNSRGVGATETRHLIDELHEYILYLYKHIYKTVLFPLQRMEKRAVCRQQQVQ